MVLNILRSYKKEIDLQTKKIKIMRKVLFVLSLSFIANVAFSQADVASLFSKYSEVDDVIHLKMGGDMFNKSEDSEIASDVDKVEVIIFPEGMESAREDLTNLGSFATRDNYELLMEVKTKDGNKIRAFTIGQNEIFSSLVLSVVGESMVLVKLDGTLHKSDIDGLDLENGDGMNILQGFKK